MSFKKKYLGKSKKEQLSSLATQIYTSIIYILRERENKCITRRYDSDVNTTTTTTFLASTILSSLHASATFTNNIADNTIIIIHIWRRIFYKFTSRNLKTIPKGILSKEEELNIYTKPGK